MAAVVLARGLAWLVTRSLGFVNDAVYYFTLPNFCCFIESNKIKIPPVMPTRGRPKGADLTVIGIPQKRKDKKHGMTGKNKPTRFVKKQPHEKEQSKVLEVL